VARSLRSDLWNYRLRVSQWRAWRGVASALRGLRSNEVVNPGIIGRVHRSGEHGGENANGGDRNSGPALTAAQFWREDQWNPAGLLLIL